jgi:hypothetical protein
VTQDIDRALDEAGKGASDAEPLARLSNVSRLCHWCRDVAQLGPT